jgi:hypothetical protein
MKGAPKIFENQVRSQVVADEPDRFDADGNELMDEEIPDSTELESVDVYNELPQKNKDAQRPMLRDSELVGRGFATKAKRDQLNLTEAIKARLLVGNTIDMIADAMVREMLTGNSSIIKEMLNRIDGPVSEQSVSYRVNVEMTPDKQMEKLRELEAKAKRRMRQQTAEPGVIVDVDED